MSSLGESHKAGAGLDLFATPSSKVAGRVGQETAKVPATLALPPPGLEVRVEASEVLVGEVVC